jgi:hypothetical protein
LKDVYVYRDHQPIDDFPTGYYDPVNAVKKAVYYGEWSEVLGWLEYVLKHPEGTNGTDQVPNYKLSIH